MNTYKTLSLLLVAVTFLVIATNAQNANQDYLDAHNAARALVSVSNITWDATLATYAMNYANSRKADCNLVHSDGPYGENLAKGSGTTFSGVDAVNLWVAEKQYYTYTTNSCSGGHICGHYTQVVWANSVKLGCARVQCTNSWWFVICEYDARGNVAGQYPY